MIAAAVTSPASHLSWVQWAGIAVCAMVASFAVACAIGTAISTPDDDEILDELEDAVAPRGAVILARAPELGHWYCCEWCRENCVRFAGKRPMLCAECRGEEDRVSLEDAIDSGRYDTEAAAS